MWDDYDIEMDHIEETDWAAANAAETNLSTDTNGQDKITVNMVSGVNVRNICVAYANLRRMPTTSMLRRRRNANKTRRASAA